MGKRVILRGICILILLGFVSMVGTSEAQDKVKSGVSQRVSFLEQKLAALELKVSQLESQGGTTRTVQNFTIGSEVDGDLIIVEGIGQTFVEYRHYLRYEID